MFIHIYSYNRFNLYKNIYSYSRGNKKKRSEFTNHKKLRHIAHSHQVCHGELEGEAHRYSRLCGQSYDKCGKKMKLAKLKFKTKVQEE